MIDNHPCVCNNSVFGDVGDVRGEHDEHRICSLLAHIVVTLTHSSKVFAKRHHPNFRSCGIVYQAFIAADDFASDRMNHGHGIVFKVLGGESVSAQFRRSIVGHIVGLIHHKSCVMAFWLIRRVFCNRGRVSLLERRGIFVLMVDMMRVSRAFMMHVRFADGGGEDGMASMGSMRVTHVILWSAPRVLAWVLPR
jgi:hypothetical protein